MPTFLKNKKIMFAVLGFSILLSLVGGYDSYGQTSQPSGGQLRWVEIPARGWFEPAKSCQEILGTGWTDKAAGQCSTGGAGRQPGNNYKCCGYAPPRAIPESERTDIYRPISPIPGVGINCEGENNNNQKCINLKESTATYFQTMFKFALGIAGILAVLMIVIGGIQYMMSDAFTSKEDAKKKIWGALWGLLLLFASVIILETINPALLNLQLRLPPLNPSALNPSSLPQQPKIGGAPYSGPTATEKQRAAERGAEALEAKTDTETVGAFGTRCRGMGGEVKMGDSVKGFLRQVCERKLSQPPAVGSSPSNPLPVPNPLTTGDDLTILRIGATCPLYIENRGQTYPLSSEENRICHYRTVGQ